MALARFAAIYYAVPPTWRVFSVLFWLQKSGAYIFRPDGDTPTATIIQDPVEEYEGTAFTEWRVSLDINWASFVVRKYSTDWEVEWMVGPIPGKCVLFGLQSATY